MMQKNKNAQKAFSELGDMFGLGGKASETEEVKKEVKAEAKSAPKAEKKDERITVIGESMSITGDIVNSGDIEIYGTVNGNIGGRDITVYGTVVGDIKASSVNMHGASIKGSIVSEADALVDEGTVITEGTLSAKNLYCNCKIVGDIIVEEKLSLDSKAYIEGNISCKVIKISEGAVIKGSINM